MAAAWAADVLNFVADPVGRPVGRRPPDVAMRKHRLLATNLLTVDCRIELDDLCCRNAPEQD